MNKKYDEKKLNMMFKNIDPGQLDFQDYVINEYKIKKRFTLLASLTFTLIFFMMILFPFISNGGQFKINKKYINSYLSMIQPENEFDYAQFYTNEKNLFNFPEVEDFYIKKTNQD